MYGTGCGTSFSLLLLLFLLLLLSYMSFPVGCGKRPPLDCSVVSIRSSCLKVLHTPTLSRLITFTLNRVHCPVQGYVVGGTAVAYQRQPKIRWFGLMVLIRSYPTRSRKNKTKNKTQKARFSRPARTVVSPSHPASSTGRESSSTQSIARQGVRFPV